MWLIFNCLHYIDADRLGSLVLAVVEGEIRNIKKELRSIRRTQRSVLFGVYVKYIPFFTRLWIWLLRKETAFPWIVCLSLSMPQCTCVYCYLSPKRRFLSALNKINMKYSICETESADLIRWKYIILGGMTNEPLYQFCISLHFAQRKWEIRLQNKKYLNFRQYYIELIFNQTHSW